MKSSSSSHNGVSLGGCPDGARPRDDPASPAACFLEGCPDGFGGMKSSSSSSQAFVTSGGCRDGARPRDDPAPLAGCFFVFREPGYTPPPNNI